MGESYTIMACPRCAYWSRDEHTHSVGHPAQTVGDIHVLHPVEVVPASLLAEERQRGEQAEKEREEWKARAVLKASDWTEDDRYEVGYVIGRSHGLETADAPCEVCNGRARAVLDRTEQEN